MIAVAVAGYAGRMGSAVVDAATEESLPDATDCLAELSCISAPHPAHIPIPKSNAITDAAACLNLILTTS